VSTPKGLLQTIIHAAAERLAADPAVPDTHRAAFRLRAISIFEQQVSAVIGADTLRISGWIIPPSARQDRRDRILQALAGDEPPKRIAGRELVSERYVRKLRAEMLARGTNPP
jgi:hypothetical protein